ncbi:hypothetical protein BDK51DRAFT_32165 [Blyttiomyces helicus]|uniref:Uncharacterized protein n=1 Tax=Blyttiomyces helicus TaxID=388810 RepID=A0A4P9WRC4_9FUNG|nr:hypothetical protein BDK51DRAFT_32165 [Blyttiomyces helicus]|eukprot:RKO94398.1 hypothetical protein BDK51DRAFT_32165 [Blyttiomyces helicus]
MAFLDEDSVLYTNHRLFTGARAAWNPPRREVTSAAHPNHKKHFIRPEPTPPALKPSNATLPAAVAPKLHGPCHPIPGMKGIPHPRIPTPSLPRRKEEAAPQLRHPAAYRMTHPPPTRYLSPRVTRTHPSQVNSQHSYARHVARLHQKVPSAPSRKNPESYRVKNLISIKRSHTGPSPLSYNAACPHFRNANAPALKIRRSTSRYASHLTSAPPRGMPSHHLSSAPPHPHTRCQPSAPVPSPTPPDHHPTITPKSHDKPASSSRSSIACQTRLHPQGTPTPQQSYGTDLSVGSWAAPRGEVTPYPTHLQPSYPTQCVHPTNPWQPYPVEKLSEVASPDPNLLGEERLRWLKQAKRVSNPGMVDRRARGPSGDGNSS